MEVYAQGSVGLAHSTVTVKATERREDETSAALFGGALGFAAGGRVGGGFLLVGYDYSPAITNRLSDDHNVGGAYVLLGGRFKTH